MACITIARIQILWNGQPGVTIECLRGTRQGDLLFPYIFVMCMEKLSRLITKEIAQIQWIPITIMDI